MAAKVLLIEDDEALAPLVVRHLTESGVDIAWATDAAAAAVPLAAGDLDLVILDVMLPGEDGLSLCRRIRKAGDTAIIMVTARGEESDRIMGLELGADDYLAKPFSLWELEARMKAVLRRYARAVPDETGLRQAGPFTLDIKAREVSASGRRIDLTRSEFDLFARLAGAPGRVFSREQLLECVQGGETGAFDRAVDTHISNLRKKLGDDPREPMWIRTVWGVGYRFRTLMIRLGLFEQLFWRVLLLLISVPMLLLLFGHLYLQGRIYDSWRQDLRQEATWTARHWGGHAPFDQLARAWRATHDNVRLSIVDPHGRTIADSHPEFIGEPSFGLHGSAPISLADGQGVLTLSRPQRFVVPVTLDLKLLGGLLGVIAISVAVFYPMVRRLTRTFSRLSEQARRVADGRFGETIDPGGQRELADLIGAFNDMSLRLEAQDVRKRRLIADVSHELRSPMARLRALGETIARHPKEARTYVAQLESEVALMDRLVGDMLETARFEEGRAELHPAPVRLDEWGADAFARSRMRIEQAAVVCTLSLAVDGVEAVIDPQRFVQVVGALVENALTAVQGRLDPAIALDLTTVEGGWTLAVTDNGRGVPEADLPYVFDRFFRVETHRARATGGAGLGLSIARSIVEAHGGTIAMDSRVGQGTTVTVRVSNPL